jgi:hypothetical protein
MGQTVLQVNRHLRGRAVERKVTTCFDKAAIFSHDRRKTITLPIFDASEEGLRIQDSVVRILQKPRRQKRVVGSAVENRHEVHARRKWRRQNPVVCGKANLPSRDEWL